MTLVKGLSIEDFARLKARFREFCGAEGAVRAAD